MTLAGLMMEVMNSVAKSRRVGELWCQKEMDGFQTTKTNVRKL